ncbi:hypothetical protein AAMO2058_001124600 [Amorphochlora amoebiformis]
MNIAVGRALIFCLWMGAMYLLMFLSKYGFVKAFPRWDKLTIDGEYMGFLAVCLLYQGVILPLLIFRLFLDGTTDDIHWWLDCLDPTLVLAPGASVLAAQSAYTSKDFFFDYAIGEGDVAMWAHHIISLIMLGATYSSMVTNTGAVVICVGLLEAGSLTWNVMCVATDFKLTNALKVIRPVFFATMLVTNTLVLTLLGCSWGIPAQRQYFGLVILTTWTYLYDCGTYAMSVCLQALSIAAYAFSFV